MSSEHSLTRGKDWHVMRRKEVLAALGISHSTLYAWIRAGKFPAPIQLGENTSAWLEQDVRDFIAERARQRDLLGDPNHGR